MMAYVIIMLHHNQSCSPVSPFCPWSPEVPEGFNQRHNTTSCYVDLHTDLLNIGAEISID